MGGDISPDLPFIEKIIYYYGVIKPLHRPNTMYEPWVLGWILKWETLAVMMHLKHKNYSEHFKSPMIPPPIPV